MLYWVKLQAHLAQHPVSRDTHALLQLGCTGSQRQPRTEAIVAGSGFPLPDPAPGLAPGVDQAGRGNLLAAATDTTVPS